MNKLFAAMAKAFPEIEGATKDSNNPAFKSKYADLSSVSEAIKPALSKHSLFYVQMTHEQTGGVCIETIVGHESGEQFSFGKLFVPATKQDAQGYGSALTYARRYSLMTAFGVCPEDDDGNAAVRARPALVDGQGNELVTPDKAAELTALAEDVGADLVKFCKYFSGAHDVDVRTLSMVPARLYNAAVSALEAKRKIAA